MRLLVDTHVFIWSTADPTRLSIAARAAVASSENSVCVSAATAWEIAIKRSLGRVRYPLEDWADILGRVGFSAIPILPRHAIEAGALPRHHGDPFDRMLIAQARTEQLVLVSADAVFSSYDVNLLR